MKILILGGDGMLGHQLLQTLGPRHDVGVTLRQRLDDYREYSLFSAVNAIDGVDARDPDRLTEVIRDVRPDAVINCIGVVKQRPEAKSARLSIEINALLPHRLLEACQGVGARLIHFSTDCVFSGRTGMYTESDLPDPVDVYGRSKLLGEVHDAPGLTIRSSIIGLELSRRVGLIEWFLAQRGSIPGYRRAIYTGLTTFEMGRLVGQILDDHPRLSGLWHVASTPISKYTLLTDLARMLNRDDVSIIANDDVRCDRSLKADRFTAATGYAPPTWDAMLSELADIIRHRIEGRRLGSWA